MLSTTLQDFGAPLNQFGASSIKAVNDLVELKALPLPRDKSAAYVEAEVNWYFFDADSVTAPDAFDNIVKPDVITLPDPGRWIRDENAPGPPTSHGALTGLDADDHTQYQKESEKGAANGYASLDASSTVPSAQIPVISHSVLDDLTTGDDHPQYQLRSEQGIANGYPDLDAGGKVPTAQLPSVSVSVFQATVGDSGADYTSIAAALAAGKTRLLMLSNLTEAGIVTLPTPAGDGGFTLHIVEDAILTIPTASGFRFNAASSVANISGEGQITYTFTTLNKKLFDGATLGAYTSSLVNINGVNIVNTSTVNGTSLTDCNFRVKNLKYSLPPATLPTAITGGGLTSISATPPVRGIVENVEIAGGGNGCSDCVNIYDGQIDLLRFTGIFHETLGTYSLTIGVNCVANNVRTAQNDSRFISVSVGGVLSDLSNNVVNTDGVNVDMVTAYARLSNAMLGPGVFRATGGDAIVTGLRADSTVSFASVRNLFVNCTFGSASSVAFSANEQRFTGCLFATAVASIPSRHIDFENCTFVVSVIVGGGALDITFLGCRVGAAGGGGGGTITINSGALRTIVSSTRVDAAILDSGTDSTLDYVIY